MRAGSAEAGAVTKATRKKWMDSSGITQCLPHVPVNDGDSVFLKSPLENAEVGCMKQGPTRNAETILPSRATKYSLPEAFNLSKVFQDGFEKK